MIIQLNFTIKYVLICFVIFGSSPAVLAQNKQIIQLRNVSTVPYPFSPGVISNGFLFVSGQVGTDPQTGKLVAGGIETETAQAIQNITTDYASRRGHSLSA